MKEHKKRFRIEFTVDVLNEGFDTEDWDWSNESIKSFALQELMCMSPFPEDITFSEVGSNWHTGTPTEKGWYLLKVVDEYGHITYAANYLRKGIKCMEWKYAFFGHVIIKWQSIEDEPEVMMG